MVGVTTEPEPSQASLRQSRSSSGAQKVSEMECQQIGTALLKATLFHFMAFRKLLRKNLHRFAHVGPASLAP